LQSGAATESRKRGDMKFGRCKTEMQDIPEEKTAGINKGNQNKKTKGFIPLK